MTAADHANAVRQRLRKTGGKDRLPFPSLDEANAALDALQTQAERAVWLEDELDECDKRADRAEAERDRARDALDGLATATETVVLLGNAREPKSENETGTPLAHLRNALAIARAALGEDA